MKLSNRINAYAWYCVFGAIVDLVFTGLGKSGIYHGTSPSWYHILFFFISTPLFGCWVVGAFKPKRVWARACEVMAFTFLFATIEDILYILNVSLVTWKWLFPWDYSWQSNTFWPGFYQTMGQNWWLDLPTGYWWSILLALLLIGIEIWLLKFRKK